MVSRDSFASIVANIGAFLIFLIIVVGGICAFLFALKLLFQALSSFQTITQCRIEFIDGSVTEATSCDKYRDDTSLECGNGKKYSVYAVKSWECKR